MARKSAGYYTKQATYATAKHNYQPTPPAAGTAIAPRPKSTVLYTPMYGEASTVYQVGASVNSIAFIVGSNLSELGLADPANPPAGETVVREPRGFAPSKVMVHYREKTGKRVDAKASGRPYIYYGSTNGPYASGTTQISYSAPICALDRTPATLLANFKNVATTLKSKATTSQGVIVRMIEEKAPLDDDIEP